MEVKEERTGWRDLGLSERHREWGWDCPALDIDFLMLEYDNGSPVALIEYKHEYAPKQKIKHPSIKALIRLGTAYRNEGQSGIPVFGVRYSDSYSWFKVTPLNVVAGVHLKVATEFTEQEYVEFLYKIRGRKMPKDLFKKPVQEEAPF